MHKIGFDNDKYLKMQSEKIQERIRFFGGKLYLEFGGKLFDDYHAARVLPGFKPDSKIDMLVQLKDEAEIVIVISAGDIENNKVRADLGITYDVDVLRLIDAFRGYGLYVGSVVLTQFNGQPGVITYQKKLESEKSVRIRDRVGFAPSVPDAIKGFPISMYNTKKEVVENPTIHIMYNMTGMSSFHAIQLLENSLTVLKMIMKLESEGKHVALDIVCKSSYDDYQDQYVMCSVRIKNGNQPMNLLKMAYPIANPGLFRRQGFAWLESQPEVEAYWSGYGVSLRHLDKDHKEEFWKNMPVDKKGLIYIDGEDCEDAGHDPIKLWENLSKK